MKLMDLLIEEFNSNLTEEQSSNSEKWERLQSKPVELVLTTNGTRHRDVETGRFVN